MSVPSRRAVRHVIQVLLQACLSTIAACLIAPWARAASIEAYPTQSSVLPGDSISFHVSSVYSPLEMALFRYGTSFTQVDRITGIPAARYAAPESSYAKGCNWPVTVSYRIPATSPSGLYAARFRYGNSVGYAPFVVLPAVRGAASRILYMVPFATYQAYNNYGGKSLYNASSTDGRQSPRVSLNRPLSESNGVGQFESAEQPFTQWFEKSGFRADYCTDMDLSQHPEILDSYNLLLIAGHDEYWTKEMRDAAEHFRDIGHNLALFNANCAYWQIRLEDSAQTIVCYKDSTTDPMRFVDPSRTTVRFRDSPVNRPEASLFGVMYTSQSNGVSRAITVNDASHWIFQGTNLRNGDSVGVNIVGTEWDGTFPSSAPGTRALFRTPMNVYFFGPSISVGGYYEKTPAYGYPTGHGGKVFAAGSVQWNLGLDNFGNAHSVPAIQMMTGNIVRAFATLDSTRAPVVVTFRGDLSGLLPDSARVVTVNVKLHSVPGGLTVALADDGNGPDSSAADGIYSGQVTIPAGSPVPLGYEYHVSGSVTAGSNPEFVFWPVDSSGVQVLPPDRLYYVVGVPARDREQAPFRVTASPNPARGLVRLGYALSGSVDPVGVAKLELFNLAGRLVRSWILPAAAEGPVSWDGRDLRGVRASSGVYFFRAEVSGRSRTTRVMWMR